MSVGTSIGWMGEIWWNVHPLAKLTHTHFPLTLGKLAPIFNPGLFFVYFRPFLIKISIIQIEKSVDGVLGIRTRGRRMVGVMIPLSSGSIGITKCYCLNNKTAINITHPASPILSIRTYCGKLLSRTTQFMLMLSLLQPWSSLYKVESLGCKITSPFNKKIGCYERWSFYFYIINNLDYCWMGKLSGKAVTPLYLKSSMLQLPTLVTYIWELFSFCIYCFFMIMASVFSIVMNDNSTAQRK